MLLLAFQRAEERGGCETVGDGSDLQSEVATLDADLLALLRPGGPAPSRCAEVELRATGRAIPKLARAHARTRRSADPARLASDLAAVRKKFESGFARGVARGDCLSPTNAADAFALLEQAVARFVGKLFPTCGDGIVEAGEGCDGTACSEVPALGDYECQTPPCQCCALHGPCYIRGFGRPTPAAFPCCSGTCNVPGLEAGPVEVFCEPLLPPVCPCFTSAMVDAAFPPGYFDQNGRGGAVCPDESTSVAIFSAGTCIWNRPPFSGPFEFPRAGVGVVPGEGCAPVRSDIDFDNDGNCDNIFAILQSVSPLQAAACVDALKASQVWQTECP